MTEQPIIPTRYKSKIPRSFSYPVGAEVISQALRDVPQFQVLIVDFHFANQRARYDSAAKPYEVIGVWYSGPIRSLHASKSLEEQSRSPRWQIRVQAIPRSLRHEIQAKVVAEALPAIRSWLLANPHSSYRQGTHGLTFRFDELDNELVSEETSSALWRTESADR